MPSNRLKALYAKRRAKQAAAEALQRQTQQDAQKAKQQTLQAAITASSKRNKEVRDTIRLRRGQGTVSRARAKAPSAVALAMAAAMEPALRPKTAGAARHIPKKGQGPSIGRPINVLAFGNSARGSNNSSTLYNDMIAAPKKQQGARLKIVALGIDLEDEQACQWFLEYLQSFGHISRYQTMPYDRVWYVEYASKDAAGLANDVLRNSLIYGGTIHVSFARTY